VALVKLRPQALQGRTHATERRYLKQAFGHPLNVSVLVVLSVFALAYGAFPWLVLGVVLELVALSALLHTRFFRARAERQLVAAELAQLRLSLDGAQLRELQRLEELAATVQKAALRPDGAPGLCSLADGEVLRRLLERFVRLSLAHKAGRELINTTDRRALYDEIRTLEMARTRSRPSLQRLQERRLELARMRVQRLDLAEERIEVLSQELAAIGEMIHFLHEQALAPPSPEGAPWADDLERLMGDIGEHDLALHELEAVAEPA
jgi:hypothetical protein